MVPLRSLFTGKGGARDIFPLPTSFDFLGSLWPSRCRKQIDWMVCVTTALNSFWGEELFGKDEASEIQIKVLNILVGEVERFCNLGLETVGIDWGSFFAVKSIERRRGEGGSMDQLGQYRTSSSKGDRSSASGRGMLFGLQGLCDFL